MIAERVIMLFPGEYIRYWSAITKHLYVHAHTRVYVHAYERICACECVYVHVCVELY